MRHIPSSNSHEIYLIESTRSDTMRYYYEILRKYTTEREIFVLTFVKAEMITNEKKIFFNNGTYILMKLKYDSE